MGALRMFGIFVTCALFGAIASTVITVSAWNVTVESKGFQCTDSMGPLSTYWGDMDTHARWGDTLSPGWTWEKLKVARTICIIAFFSLWAVSTAMLFRIAVRRWQRPNQARGRVISVGRAGEGELRSGSS